MQVVCGERKFCRAGLVRKLNGLRLVARSLRHVRRRSSLQRVSLWRYLALPSVILHYWILSPFQAWIWVLGTGVYLCCATGPGQSSTPDVLVDRSQVTVRRSQSEYPFWCGLTFTEFFPIRPISTRIFSEPSWSKKSVGCLPERTHLVGMVAGM